MNFFEFLKIKSFINNISGYLVDFTDRLHFVYTPVIFISAFSLLGVENFYVKVIYCTVPFEFSKAWDDFVQNFCWVQPTYHLLQDGRFPKNSEKSYIETNYHQWTPIVFLLFSMLSFIPYLIWKKLSGFCGINIMSKLRNLKLKLNYQNQDSLEELSKEISCSIVDYLESRLTDYCGKFSRANLYQKYKSRFQNFGFIRYFYHRSGNALFTYYVMIKILFVINEVLQIYLLKKFLAQVKLTFGYDILLNIIQGRTWENTGLFPRIVGCDVEISQTGQNVNRSFLCVLPINMIYEKIFILLWFWLIFCSLLSFISIIYWSIYLCPVKSRKSMIEKMLLIQEIDIVPDKISFIKFLRLDGIFILRMLALNNSLYCSSIICKDVYKIYNHKRKHWKKFEEYNL